MTQTKTVGLETSVGQFLDIVSILELKSELIDDPDARAAVLRDLERYAATKADLIVGFPSLKTQLKRLKGVNRGLWTLEDKIRAEIADGDDNAHVAATARRIIRANDLRHKIKSRIDRMTASEIHEVKSYNKTAP